MASHRLITIDFHWHRKTWGGNYKGSPPPSTHYMCECSGLIIIQWFISMGLYLLYWFVEKLLAWSNILSLDCLTSDPVRSLSFVLSDIFVLLVFVLNWNMMEIIHAPVTGPNCFPLSSRSIQTNGYH